MWIFSFYPRRVQLCELRNLSESRCPERGGGRLPSKVFSISSRSVYPDIPFALGRARPTASKDRRRRSRTEGVNFSKNFPVSPKRVPFSNLCQKRRRPVNENPVRNFIEMCPTTARLLQRVS